MNTHSIKSVILYSSPKNGGGGGTPFTEEFIENPFQIDIPLYTILIEIFRLQTYEETSRVFRGLSRKTFDIIRSLKTRYIPLRHFAGIISLSFQSALTDDDFDVGIHKNYSSLASYELTRLNDPTALLNNEIVEANKPRSLKSAKVNELLKKFSLFYWQSAARQAVASKRICRLCFGLSHAVVDTLASASFSQIEYFAKYYPQRFKLIYDEFFFQSLTSIENAGDNATVSFLKAAYAMQNTNAFKRARHSLSTTATFALTDLVAQTPKRQTQKMSLVHMWWQKNQDLIVDEQSVKYHMQRNEHKQKTKSVVFQSASKQQDISSEISESNAERKQRFVTSDFESKKLCCPWLHALGLKNNQIATIVHTTEAQARNETSKLRWDGVDGRKHKRQKKEDDDGRYFIDPNDRKKGTQSSIKKVLQETFFLSLYFTLADEKGLEEVDLIAFFTAYAIMSTVTVRTQLKFEEEIATSEALDILLYALQGHFQAQRCPVCGLISFYPKPRGQYVETPDDIYTCCIDLALSRDTTLAKFSEHLRNSSDTVPDDADEFVFEHREIANPWRD